MVFSYPPQSAASHPGALPTSHSPPPWVSDPHPVAEHAADIRLSSGFPPKPSYSGTGKGFPGPPAAPGVLSSASHRALSQLCGFIYCLHMSCLPTHPVRARAVLKNTAPPHFCSLLRIPGLSSSVSLHILKTSFPQRGLSLAFSPGFLCG